MPKSHPVRYHLRAHASAEHFTEEVAALRQVLRTARIDEVTVMVPHAEEASPGMSTDTENRACVERLRPLFAEWREAGLATSLNLWWTQGYSDFPGAHRDLRSRFDYRWAISESGVSGHAIACPRDERWRAQVYRTYATFAELQPRVLWIDDDVRAGLRGTLQSPCFCPVCVAAVGRRVGRDYTRQELVAALIADPPNPVRSAWLDLLETYIRELDAGIAAAVHAVSPRTSIGLMVSPPEGHAAEGRDWSRLYAAVGPRPWVRPSLACYQDGTVDGMAQGLNITRLTQALTPPGVSIAPEVENYPQSRFFKSARLVELQLQMCQVLGIPETTFSIYRFGGRLDLERETIWEDTLGRLKPRLAALAALGATAAQQRGVSLAFHQREGHWTRERTAPRFSFLQVHRPFDKALPLLGFPTTYGPGGVTVLCGEQPFCYATDELRARCASGLLLDARAAAAMIELGHGEWIGVSARLPNVPASLEIVTDNAFGRVGEPMNLRLDGAPWQFTPGAGTRAISLMRGLDGQVLGHGVLLSENDLGGRVAILPLDSQYPGAIASATFINWPRQAQLRQVLAWLGRAPLPLFVPGAPSVYPLLVDQGERRLVAVANLSHDPIADLTLELPADRPVREIRLLGAADRWRQVKAASEMHGDRLLLRTGLPLANLDVAVLQLR